MQKTICVFGRQWEADLAIALLRDRGFHPAAPAVSPHITFGGTDITYQVKLPEEEVSTARNVLSEGGYRRHIMG